MHLRPNCRFGSVGTRRILRRGLAFHQRKWGRWDLYGSVTAWPTGPSKDVGGKLACRTLFSVLQLAGSTKFGLFCPSSARSRAHALRISARLAKPKRGLTMHCHLGLCSTSYLRCVEGFSRRFSMAGQVVPGFAGSA